MPPITRERDMQGLSPKAMERSGTRSSSVGSADSPIVPVRIISAEVNRWYSHLVGEAFQASLEKIRVDGHLCKISVYVIRGGFFDGECIDFFDVEEVL